MVTKKELLTGIIKFVKNEVIPYVDDNSMKMILSGCLYAIDAKPSIVDPVFANPMVAAVLQGEDGKYDVETIFSVLTKLVDDYGRIPITIPPIKFVTSNENTLTFRKDDIAKLKEYVIKEENNA